MFPNCQENIDSERFIIYNLKIEICYLHFTQQILVTKSEIQGDVWDFCVLNYFAQSEHLVDF
jgi:hypothetical protein